MARDHYVTQKHLELFLPDGSTDKRLHVYSKTEGYLGRERIQDIAYKEALNPKWAETKMSKIEGVAVGVLRQICSGTSPDDAKSQEYLLLYMALSSSRHPDFIEEWRRRLHQMAAQDPHFLDRWRWMLHERRLFKALLNQLVPAIAQTLPQLQWTIVRLPGDGPEMFAISDKPIDICWAGPVGIPNPHTIITMPICKHALLVGGQEPENVKKLFLHAEQVNAIQLTRCHEFIYSGYELDFDELKRVADRIPESHGVLRVRRTLWTPRPPHR